MRFLDDRTMELPLLGGVVQEQRLVVPHAVIVRLKSWRQACRLAWKLRFVRNMTQLSLAERAGLYASHVSDYFSVHELTKKGKPRRELPARHVRRVQHVLGNTVMSQYLAHQGELTVLEEVQVERHQMRRQA